MTRDAFEGCLIAAGILPYWAIGAVTGALLARSEWRFGVLCGGAIGATLTLPWAVMVSGIAWMYRKHEDDRPKIRTWRAEADGLPTMHVVLTTEDGKHKRFDDWVGDPERYQNTINAIAEVGNAGYRTCTPMKDGLLSRKEWEVMREVWQEYGWLDGNGDVTHGGLLHFKMNASPPLPPGNPRA